MIHSRHNRLESPGRGLLYERISFVHLDLGQPRLRGKQVHAIRKPNATILGVKLPCSY